MQQTQTYKLNLLETSDAFSPSPLNENMEKVEGALAAKTDAAATAALEQRVVALEAHKMVVGSYIGDGAMSRDIDLGFAPKALFTMQNAGNRNPQAIFEGISVRTSSGNTILAFTENGFRVGHTNYTTYNNSKEKYYFVAFA